MPDNDGYNLFNLSIESITNKVLASLICDNEVLVGPDMTAIPPINSLQLKAC